MDARERRGRSDEDGARLAAWIEQHVGGTVTRVERMPRWRPAWDVDVDVDGRLVPLHARESASRASRCRTASPTRSRCTICSEAHGLPVPHAYGLCDEPYALVMDRLSGLVDLAGASDAERDEVLEEYLELLARIYAIPLDAAAAAGFAVPADSATTELAFIRRMEDLYDRDTAGHPADPVEVFLRRWLRDHVPEGRRDAARFITYDSFQFMFEGGHITGLLDFEHAHVGDPMMDLAALRIRDTLKSLGDLPALDRALRGGDRGDRRPRRRRVPDRALQRAVGRVGRAAAGRCGARDRLDLLPRVVRQRRALGVRVDRRDPAATHSMPVEIPEPRPTRHAAGLRYLVDGMRAAAARDRDDYELASLGRIASHLKRVDEIGAQFDADDLDDVAALLGHRPEPVDADAELVEFIGHAGPEHEEPLVRLLDAARPAGAPHHGVADVADAAPPCAAQPAARTRDRARRGRELAHRRDPRDALIDAPECGTEPVGAPSIVEGDRARDSGWWWRAPRSAWRWSSRPQS